MPALSNVAACIDGGVVVNVAALSTENDYSGWVTAMEAAHDAVLIVAQAGIGWEEYEAGKVRMPQPDPDCVWDEDGQTWDCPDPEPEPPTP